MDIRERRQVLNGLSVGLLVGAVVVEAMTSLAADPIWGRLTSHLAESGLLGGLVARFGGIVDWSAAPGEPAGRFAGAWRGFRDIPGLLWWPLCWATRLWALDSVSGLAFVVSLAAGAFAMPRRPRPGAPDHPLRVSGFSRAG